MNRTEFIVVTAVILFVAFALGWFANWLVYRFTRVTRAEIGELDRMAQALHDAEETRDEALIQMEEQEAKLNARNQQLEAELRTAMEGLREARSETEELRDWIDKHQKKA
ncbi:hypothetical protein [Pseudoroseicyclus aestuarii]|uniref:Uncharacterized protein n=1 Tax=Pseudoroseicyclus aestuarii TaxID=1795041 RepID=A0A318SSR6_9RHOB|nr:hypothetical protein [Pseudoroseicyclus aestuarii]PYE84743.1 hypothetical protein DFP88_102546 [Pseudoroseicyclus aestuarii]